MTELLNNYSLTEILMFIIMLAFAIKGVIDFYDWAKKRIKEPVDKAYTEKEMKQKVLDTLESHNEQIDKISKAIDILIASDKDDIKSWITEKHHYFCYELGYIDDYNYQCIEARYKHYKEEDGNTFIDSFIEDIRALPKVSVINKKENK
jgi:hypothetical protein